MREKILEAVRAAMKAALSVKITFRREATRDVSYLLGMSTGNIIGLSAGDELTLMAIMESNDWGRDCNRTVIMSLTSEFDEDWFVSRLERALESIEVVQPFRA